VTSPQARAAGVSLVLLDVDGVLTDGGILYEGADTELKRFDIQDGMGISMAIRGGLRVGILTGRTSPMVERRGRELGMAVVKQGFHDKRQGFDEILAELAIDSREIAYIGDDIQDLPVLWRSGFTGAPANAVDEVRSQVDYVCRRAGGRGAVREFIEVVLEHKGIRAQVIAAFTGAKP
jgi:3-deoxy-D-manno-octulosonate 8-phosphate phosphatase (KDO 8-P phosphatase)